jgi:glycosyltransferase involved in cell wall biosynthesis
MTERASRRKIAFVSPHCLVDYTNGAATATRDGLRVLAEQGFECMAICGTRLDDPTEGLIQESLFRRGIKYEVRRVKFADGESGGWGDGESGRASVGSARLIFLVEGRIPVTLFENCSTRGGWFNVQEAQAFLTACDIFLRKNRPDVVVTYGGDPVSIAVQRLAKRLGIKIVFWLHNFSYSDRTAFEAADYVIVPSEFSRQFYRERLGLECYVLPNIVNWEAAEVRGKQMGRVGDGETGRADGKVAGTVPVPSALRPEPQAASAPDNRSRELRADGTRSVPATLYLTFINPHAVKGVYVFARIARELARRRPDIPILVTQGRSRTDALAQPDLGLLPHLLGQFPIAPTCDGRNITTMPFTPDPRSFYPAVFANSRLLLMPSLWLESFGLVAAEAMLNGIPVLASNRGALPETIGGRMSPHPSPLPEGEGTIGPYPSPPSPLPEGEGAGGFLFDIPARYTSETRDVPTAEEVAPWVETIIRLWDGPAEYDRRSRAAREHAQRWRPERLAPLYREFFSNVARQPGAPIAPLNRY